MLLRCGSASIRKEYLLPTRIVDSRGLECPGELLYDKPAAISWRTDNCARLTGKGAYVLLDFGRELCGGVRMAAREVQAPETQALSVNQGAMFRLTFGESVGEACAPLGEKNAQNAHAARDFSVTVPSMSVQEFGQTGFRFLRAELLTDTPVRLTNLWAFCTLPDLAAEASIVTNDPLVNRILDTAAYTLKLCFQDGWIWDGIKRDRLVWCGDMHPEILTSLYLFGKTENVTNSLTFLRENTPADGWINNMPTYSAWWVANLCEYVRLTGDTGYFDRNRDYAESILARFNRLVDEDGTMHLSPDPANDGNAYFLDWPTHLTPDERSGGAALLVWTARQYLDRADCPAAAALIRKLAVHLNEPVTKKQVRAFQVLAGGDPSGTRDLLEQGGARGMSTFMGYYILTAAARVGSGRMLEMMKDYYGAMLSRGATTFWEDFDLDWLEGSGSIDELPRPGQKDLHGDYGRFCYTRFRHSLCHGWSAGVAAFFVETVLGLSVGDGYRSVTVRPRLLGLTDVDAVLPTPFGPLEVHLHGGRTAVTAPAEIAVRVEERDRP